MSTCGHKNTQIWEPHLAGARKCIECGMVYNPNHNPAWHIEPPSNEEIIRKLSDQLDLVRLNLNIHRDAGVISQTVYDLLWPHADK